MTSSQNSVDVLSKLENENINAIIPNELLKSEYLYDNYILFWVYGGIFLMVYSASFYSAEYHFGNKDFAGTITINKYNDDFDFLIGQNFADEEYESFEQISRDDKEILVFGDDETSNIYYIIDNVEYLIVIDSGYSTAYNIAVTL